VCVYRLNGIGLQGRHCDIPAKIPKRDGGRHNFLAVDNSLRKLDWRHADIFGWIQQPWTGKILLLD
jgi:hypothetical protein